MKRIIASKKRDRNIQPRPPRFFGGGWVGLGLGITGGGGVTEVGGASDGVVDSLFGGSDSSIWFDFQNTTASLWKQQGMLE